MSSDDSTPKQRQHVPGPDGERDRADSKAGPGPDIEAAGESEDPSHRTLRQLHQTLGNAFVQRLMADRPGRGEAGEPAKGPDRLAIQRFGSAAHVNQPASAQATTDWPAVSANAITATTQAIATWKTSATLVGVMVNAVTASGGTLVGPPLMPLILAGMGAGTPPHVAQAFAMGAGQAWLMWQGSVKVPGLPWYPAFAAVPSPVAPPTPNVPTPLAALLGRWITTVEVAVAIRGLLGKPVEPGKDKAIADFAAWFAGAFRDMIQNSMVTNVLGTGSVPTWAPPYVPVGPVVSGMANSTPGFLVSTQAAAPAPAQGPASSPAPPDR